MAAHDRDVIGDVNQHTHGTEFYGTSSNYVFLNQLFSYARLHLHAGHAGSDIREETSYISPSSLPGEDRSMLRDPGSGSAHDTILAAGGVSVINLLSDEEALLPPSRAKTPPHIVEKGQTSSHVYMSQPDPTSQAQRPAVSQPSPEVNRCLPSGHMLGPDKSRPAGRAAIQLAERRLEREFVRSFLHNLHYLHPMLDSVVFTARCQELVWGSEPPDEKSKNRRHFFALYNIVVAVGALVAGSDTVDELSQGLTIYEQNWHSAQIASREVLFQTLSRQYFRKSRALLGDVFEVCSLDSAQALLLMVSSNHACC